jgi:hypothetical protein
LLIDNKILKQNRFDAHQAIVIGGSMAGLLAARVLSEHFERVTIIERDHLLDDAQPRIVRAVLSRELFSRRQKPGVSRPPDVASSPAPMRPLDEVTR